MRGACQLAKGFEMDVFRTKSMPADTVAVAALILSGCSGGVATTSESSTVAQPVGAELVIHGRGLRRWWVVAVGHDRRPWRFDCSISSSGR